jgi:hypothetical protein
LTTKNATEVICHRKSPSARSPVNEIGTAISLFAYALRIISKVSFPCDTNRPQTLWWDDAVMTIAMFFLIIPLSALGMKRKSIINASFGQC